MLMSDEPQLLAKTGKLACSISRSNAPYITCNSFMIPSLAIKQQEKLYQKAS